MGGIQTRRTSSRGARLLARVSKDGRWATSWPSFETRARGALLWTRVMNGRDDVPAVSRPAQRAADGVLPGGDLAGARRFVHGGGKAAVERPTCREGRRLRIEARLQPGQIGRA